MPLVRGIDLKEIPEIYIFLLALPDGVAHRLKQHRESVSIVTVPKTIN